MENKLGKRRGILPIHTVDGSEQKGGIFRAPAVFLGNTPLRMGPVVASYDFKGKPMGILGMDCLKHYCIQVDFQTRKMQFLDSRNLNAAELGKAFALDFKGAYPFIHQSGFAGYNSDMLIDLG